MKHYLLGASNPESVRMIKAVQAKDPSFNVAGFLDNDTTKHGDSFYGYPVLGGFELLPDIVNESSRFINLITRNSILRYQTTSRLISHGASLANFIHPSVDLTMVDIGVGNYIQEGVILQAGVSIGDNCSIHMGALVGHETRVHDDTFIAHGVSISGCCDIGQGCFVGTNATIFPRVDIGEWSTIGAGSVVRKHVEKYSTMIGNPAKVIKKTAPKLMEK